jgi:hypothetical protein
VVSEVAAGGAEAAASAGRSLGAEEGSRTTGSSESDMI